MKKNAVSILLIAILLVSFCIPAFAEDEDWKEMPVLTHCYEYSKEKSKEKIYLEWEGKADCYKIYVDENDVFGKNKVTNLNKASIDISPGINHIIVVPIKIVSKNVDTRFDIGMNVSIGEGPEIGGSGSIDLGAFGIDPKDVLQGTPSQTFTINYTVNPILSATPEITGADTDFDGRVRLFFTDKYASDIYRIAIKSGKDINYVEFDTTSEDAIPYINKTNSSVTITLDQEYLKKQRCMIPELDQKYSFSVQLQQWPENLVDGIKETGTVLCSKDSKAFDYTPYAAWKNAPEITYASQTADGEVTLQWEHEDNGLGCEYKIISVEKVLGVKKGQKEIGSTTDRKYTVKDLMNGKYTYTVVPVLSREEGIASEETTVEVQNNWVAAPVLECEQSGNQQILLKWTAPDGVESYHITVSAGSGSVLRFVNLDYKKYTEFDVQAQPGSMEYVFSYDEIINPENGTKLKFEIYAVRHTADGAEQKSAASSQTIIMK